MSQVNQKLAASLELLHQLQQGGRHIFRSKELSRTHRERLVRNGFLREIVKGWWMSSSPNTRDGDSTPWFVSFWEFCGSYCTSRFGESWHLSPELSALLHAGNSNIPTQVVVYSPEGSNNLLELPFKTSIYDLKHPGPQSSQSIVLVDGLRLFSPTETLCRLPEQFYRRYPNEAQVLLSQVLDSGSLLRPLLQGAHSVVAGRLAGAYRRVGNESMAEEIIETMRSADFSIYESDPFSEEHTVCSLPASVPPIVARLRTFWALHRDTVRRSFASRVREQVDRASYLDAVDEVYQSDAYHSLSIEGFSVSKELIERVSSGDWDPSKNLGDFDTRDALAARGYWQAFQAVREDVGQVLGGTNPGELVRKTHMAWYRQLFQPCVAAGLIGAEALAGYRNDAVYLRGSRYVPPRWEAVRDAMSALFDLLSEEPDACVRATLGHWALGYIHPYPDGNGRIARFLMNVMLASGGYPWVVIRLEDRKAYLQALESASVEGDIDPFAQFIARHIVSV